VDPREIQKLEELCVQDESPWCQAACPLHVDVRGMLAAVARGDFTAAAALYRKKAPFPAILSRVCDQPCRDVCKRREAGGALTIGLLERSCAEFAGFAADPPLRPGTPANGRVAVVGAGLAGLTAALELARRRHTVVLFEATGRVGGKMRDLPPDELPPEVIDAEIDRVRAYGVEFRLGVHLGRGVSLADLAGRYDAVFLSVGDVDPGADTQGLDPDSSAALLEARLSGADPLTLATSRPGVFAGGSLRRGPEGGRGAAAHSPVSSISDGVRAAVSIDRFLKQESLTAQRSDEGPYASRLYTSLAGVTPASPVLPNGPGIGYAPGEAREEAGRCLQCQCLECVKACEYLQHFREYPGAVIRKVTKNITSLPGKSLRTHTKFINACSLCGLCGAVCPTDLDMAVVNSEARGVMCDRGLMPPAIHEFAMRDMEASADDLSLLVRHQPGHDSSAYVFFPGCQLPASAPDNVEETYRHLAATLAGGVGLLLGCCGAPAAWSGRQTYYAERRATLTAQWRSLGSPRAILACPTCSLMFASALPDIPATSLWEVLDQEGLLPGAPPASGMAPASGAPPAPGVPPASGAPTGRGKTLAIHDSCTAREARGIQDGVRSLVGRLGYQVEELRYSRELTKCCSYGGLMALVNPAVSGKVVEARIDESPLDYLTYCSNCRDFFAERGKPAYHVLDLIFGRYQPGVVVPGPTLSQRRENRRRLAARMLAELWGEEMPTPPEHLNVKVRIPAELAARMEKDRILIEDVQQVIHHAETSGDKLAVLAAGRFIAHYRPSLVTYWVEYGAEGEEFVVCNVYSHRMQIVDDPAGRPAPPVATPATEES
jgi:glutamate synthase (NADPH) small chain